MAYTSIIPVHRLDNSFNYIKDKEKTTKPAASAGSLEEAIDYALIRDSQRGSCLYKCGNERYLLQVQAPEYKQALFGTAGGR